MAARSRSADGNETSLTRFFAAAMAPVERGNPAKCPVDLSVSFRGSTIEVVCAEYDFERAAATDEMWKAFRTATTGMQSHPDFGVAESRVLAETASRWAQLARQGKKVMQFLQQRRYIAVVVEGKARFYGNPELSDSGH
jgi:hypothetical protein